MSFEVWVVAATFLGPIVAVQTQKWIERATERGRTRRKIFQALMSNRATRLSDDFVRALNLIDLEFVPSNFGGTKDKDVIDAWRSLFGEYHDAPNDEASAETQSAWNQRIDDRLVLLLFAMSKSVGYQFSNEQLRRGIYYPRGRVELEKTQNAVLNGLRHAIEGKLAIPMKITEFPNSPELLAAQIAMAQKAANSYDSDGSVKVKLMNIERGS